MDASTLRTLIVRDVALLPDSKLPQLYAIVEALRTEVQSTSSARAEQAARVIALAGSWGDWSEEAFDAFLQDTAARRKRAFSGRFDRATGTD